MTGGLCARLLPLLAGLALVAPAAAQRTRVVVVVPGQVTQVVSDTMGTAYVLPFPAAAVYRLLPEVYGALKIPTEFRDSMRLQVGSDMFHRTGSLAGRQLSTFVSCGDGMTGPNADYYRVYMNIWSTVTPDGESAATLRTAYLAGAVNMSEGSRQPMPCESSGRLEIRIHQEVLKKLLLNDRSPESLWEE